MQFAKENYTHLNSVKLGFYSVYISVILQILHIKCKSVKHVKLIFCVFWKYGKKKFEL